MCHHHCPPPIDVPACAEKDFQTLTYKSVYESVAAQLNCDYKLIKNDALHVIEQYLQHIADLQEGDAEAEAPGAHAHSYTLHVQDLGHTSACSDANPCVEGKLGTGVVWCSRSKTSNVHDKHSRYNQRTTQA
jgi:hypothetical protein